MARQRKRRGWFSFLARGAGDPPGTRYELVVLEGSNAGARYALDRPQQQIGRGIPGRPSEGGIELGDRSVSAKHALVSCEDGEIFLEHLPSATNPTLVNGRRIKRKRVRDGDRIVLGLVVLELRANTPPPPVPSRAIEDRVPPSGVETDPVSAKAVLVLRDGIDDRQGERFPLARRRTSIGRDEDCDIVLDVGAVSRNHAALVWQDDQLVLIHESAVNPTHVNDMEITDRRRLFDGDEIRISERVRFEVQLETPAEKPAVEAAPTPAAEATRLTRPPPLDAEATRFDEVPEPAPAPASNEAPAIEEMAATRVFVLPDEPATPPDTPAPTPTPSPQPPPADYSDGQATRIAPAPAAARFSEGDATRIAPVPSAAAAPPDLTRIAGDADEATNGEANAARDEAKTIIRPSPSAALADSERTVVRPPPTPPRDADATLIRPRPEETDEAVPAAETVVLQDDEDESEG